MTWPDKTIMQLLNYGMNAFRQPITFILTSKRVEITIATTINFLSTMWKNKTIGRGRLVKTAGGIVPSSIESLAFILPAMLNFLQSTLS